jgi:cytochrome P450
VIDELDDFLGAGATSDPYRFFSILRELSPVVWSERFRSWIFTGWDPVSKGLRDQRLSSARLVPNQITLEMLGIDPVFDLLSGWVTFNDPPAHTRLRTAIQDAFKPTAIRRLERGIQSRVDGLLEKLLGMATFDVVASFAEPLPDGVIAEFLGIPRDGRDLCKSWANDLRPIVFGSVDDPGRFDRALQGTGRFREYLSEVLEAKASRPEEDLLSELVSSGAHQDGLTTDEIVATAAVLLFGGQETSKALITNSLAALANFPEAQMMLRAAPEILPAAIEEFVRFDGPTKFTMRTAREDVETEGGTVSAGDRVFLGIASANRDGLRFADPDCLDFCRSDPRHVGFGFGIHHCVGAPLARLEVSIALRSFLTSFAAYEVAGPVTWRPSLVDRSVEQLQIRPL